MRFNFDTDWFNNNKWVKVTVQVRTTIFLNVMVNFVIVNQKLTGSALLIEKNQTIIEFEKKSAVSTPHPGTKKILMHTVVVTVTLQTSYKNGMIGPGGGGLSKCAKSIYNASPSNQVISVIWFRTVACLYTYFYLTEHDLVFEKLPDQVKVCPLFFNQLHFW